MSTERVGVQEDEKAELFDDFTDRRAAGAVTGTLSTSGHRRLGVDVEGVLSIDNGALRIAPLIEAGFGRAVLAYGPFSMRPGAAFAVYLLNGHNTAQDEPLSDSFRERIVRWLKGSEADPQWLRLLWWARRGRFRRAVRQLRWWKRTAKHAVPPLNENLAIGWFATAMEPDPRLKGSGFIMHALGPENGELWAGQAEIRTRALRGVQNVPLYYVAVARDNGTVYYVSSIEGAAGLPPYPWMRPVSVDHCPLSDECYLGVQQSVLGQIGFRLDTRIYGIRVGRLAGYETWCGGAHAAHTTGSVSEDPGSAAEVGGAWEVWHSQAKQGIAVLDPGVPSGLIHALATAAHGQPAGVGLVCRCLDERNHWRLELAKHRCVLTVIADGDRQVVASRDLSEPDGTGMRRLQILDDGSRLMAYVDGEPIADAWVTDSRLNDATKVGILIDGPEQHNGTVRSFEAHPRHVKLPKVFDMGAPWLRKGTLVVVADDFTGTHGDLQGRLTPVGGKRWSRIMGQGFIDVTGAQTAKVRASAREPCPGRTAYCLDWPHPEFADAEVTITPPGARTGERERTTAGFILYQDDRNYVILNAYRSDYYPAGSVSTFFKFGGLEDIYDAVWSNVADRINYGMPLRLRLCCDGERYLVFINDEPVLYRAFRDVYPETERLQIRKVGIVANWEFGTDTGSTFEQLKLRA